MGKQKCENCLHWAFSNRDIGRCLKAGSFKHPTNKKVIAVISKKEYVCKDWRKDE